jgi:probable F420-dependent oxidoreductase
MGIRVGVGVAALGFETASGWLRFAERCEALGVDSLWQTDRLVARGAPYLEALSAMAALAGATSRLKFGMNAVVLPLRDPFLLARQCATVDWLSGGRLLPVFGVGAESAPEWKALGRDPRGRGRRADEMLEVMRRLWDGERVSYRGRYVVLEEAELAPAPVQRPLPCWIGGHSPAAVRRTARFGTGWLAGIAPPERVAPTVRAIHEAAREEGRSLDPEHFGATLLFRFGSRDDPELARLAGARGGGDADPSPVLAVGGAREIVARLRTYAEAGASKFVAIPVARGEAALGDQLERLAGEVLPEVESEAFRASLRPLAPA